MAPNPVFDIARQVSNKMPLTLISLPDLRFFKK